MKFLLKIQLGNAEMQTAADIAEALRDVLDNLDRLPDGGTVRDANGNTVGEWGIIS
jgi:hypothetical protein